MYVGARVNDARSERQKAVEDDCEEKHLYVPNVVRVWVDDDDDDDVQPHF